MSDINTPKFRTEGKDKKTCKLFLQCSKCEVDIRQLKDTDVIDVRHGHYCKDCDDGSIRLNLPEQQPPTE